MPSNHIGPRKLKSGVKSVSYFSKVQPRYLIIFVHGFGGSAINTWNDFPLMTTSNAAFSECDIAFYGYDSLRSQLNNLGLRFYNFLKSISSPDINSQNRQRGIDENFRYERIILVAHSLGALVTRKALLLAYREEQEWLHLCKMVLFAPAHKGARIPALLESLSGFTKIITRIAAIKFPITDDLHHESRAIRTLINETTDLLNENSGDFTIAHSVIWAGNEIVVINDVFCSDPIPEEIIGASHTSVCKPLVGTYVRPIDLLLNAIN